MASRTVGMSQALRKKPTNRPPRPSALAISSALVAPFPQEEELRTKSARLNELNAELNIDESTPIERAAECRDDDIVAKSAKPSVLGKLKSVQAQGGSNTAKKKLHEEVL